MEWYKGKFNARHAYSPNSWWQQESKLRNRSHATCNITPPPKEKKNLNEWMNGTAKIVKCVFTTAESTLSVSLRSTSECGSVSRIRLPPDINAIKHIITVTTQKEEENNTTECFIRRPDNWMRGSAIRKEAKIRRPIFRNPFEALVTDVVNVKSLSAKR